MNNTKVTQSIVREIEYLEFRVLRNFHEIVCHDGNEALGIIAHTFHDILLHLFPELILVFLIQYQVQRFDLFFALVIR